MTPAHSWTTPSAQFPSDEATVVFTALTETRPLYTREQPPPAVCSISVPKFTWYPTKSQKLYPTKNAHHVVPQQEPEICEPLKPKILGYIEYPWEPSFPLSVLE